MAGRGRKKLSREELKNRKWLFGVYTRRSFDDGDDAESNTIINQKHLIEAHLEKLSENIEIVDYYVDDGYTGTNFNRPSFKRLMNDVLSGKINGIIVKDLSRLGRNHLEVGKYIEEIFPLHSIRIIAVNDDVDSFNNPESIRSLNVPIKNLVNEGVSRDLSKKVASAYDSMARNRQFVAGTTPYGYALDPNDKHHLVIDEKEAKIIKEIFKMALEGNGRIKICKYLNSQGILCRKEISRRKKANLSLEPFALESRYYWGTTTIGRILTNETYIGNLVQGKRTRLNHKAHNFVRVAEGEWVISKNHHEPIIREDIFYQVQEIIYDRNIRINTHGIYNKYVGFLKCSECGNNLYRMTRKKRGKTQVFYYCGTYIKTRQCNKHYMLESKIDKAVLEAINQHLELICDIDRRIDETVSYSRIDYDKEVKRIKIIEIDKEILQYENLLNSLIKDYQCDIISQEDFEEFKNDYLYETNRTTYPSLSFFRSVTHN